jgi:hypothetical protein
MIPGTSSIPVGERTVDQQNWWLTFAGLPKGAVLRFGAALSWLCCKPARTWCYGQALCRWILGLYAAARCWMRARTYENFSYEIAAENALRHVHVTRWVLLDWPLLVWPADKARMMNRAHWIISPSSNVIGRSEPQLLSMPVKRT